MFKNMYLSSRNILPVLVSFQWMLTFLDIFSKNIEISNFAKIRPVGAELFQAGIQTDGRTDKQTGSEKDGHDEVNSHFS